MKAVRWVWVSAIAVFTVTTVASALDMGFETGDGFNLGTGPWPTGWTAKPSGVAVGNTWVTGGSQSLEVGLSGPWNWSAMDYALPVPILPQPGVVTELSLDIRTSAGSVPGYYNFVGYAFFIISDRDGYPVGGVSFDLQDWQYASDNQPNDFVIQTTDPVNWYGWAATGKHFAPGAAYRFTTLLDWSAGTTTLMLTTLDGSAVIHQATVNSVPNGVAAARFGGPSHDQATMPAYFDNFYVGAAVPEPASLLLLSLGAIMWIRRRG